MSIFFGKLVGVSRAKCLAGLPFCALMAVASAQANDVSISSPANGGTISISASADRFAGAIDSLTFRSVQYVDISDHGREMQTAIQAENLGECYNPTEAGSKADGTALTSSSVLNSISNTGNVLQTQTRAAFWLAPGENYGGPCNANVPGSPTTAQNTTVLSNFVFGRTMSFYGTSIPNMVNVAVTITVPENHTATNTEALSNYLPSTFNVFLTYDRASRTLTKVAATSTDSASQHTSYPVIIAQTNGANAMGAMSSEIITNPAHGYMAYLNFSTAPNPSSKWSCVFGESNVTAGSVYSYSCPVAVGNVDEVVTAINAYPVPGQTLTSMVPIFRFYGSSHHLMTLSYAEGAGAGNAFETTGFHVFPVAGAGYQPLYRCLRSAYGDNFISTQSNCEGFTVKGLIGYAATATAPGLYALYRFYRNSNTDHLITINYSEGINNNYTYEGTLGYVGS